MGNSEAQGSLACCGPWVAKSQKALIWEIVKHKEAWHAVVHGLQRVRDNLGTEYQQADISEDEIFPLVE